MFVSSVLALYNIVLCLCLLLSFLHRKRDQSYLFVYFLVMVLVEFSPNLLHVEPNRIYTFGSFFFIAYFTYYYALQLKNRKILIYILGFGAEVSAAIAVNFTSHTFSPVLALIISLFYVILGLIWLYDQIKNETTIFIAQKQAFWITTSLIVWSVVFIFRISLMYWLYENDYSLLTLIDKIFKVVSLISYIFFLIAVTRKN